VALSLNNETFFNAHQKNGKTYKKTSAAHANSTLKNNAQQTT
jgi:hypothetical protein